jgi:hypothetical protein
MLLFIHSSGTALEFSIRQRLATAFACLRPSQDVADLLVPPSSSASHLTYFLRGHDSGATAAAFWFASTDAGTRIAIEAIIAWAAENSYALFLLTPIAFDDTTEDGHWLRLVLREIEARVRRYFVVTSVPETALPLLFERIAQLPEHIQNGCWQASDEALALVSRRNLAFKLLLDRLPSGS